MKKIFLFLLVLISVYTVFSQSRKIEYRFESQKPDTIIYIPDRVKDTKASDALNIQAYVHKDSVIFFDKKKFYDYRGFSRREMSSQKLISFIEGEGRNDVDEQEYFVSSRFAWVEIVISFILFALLFFMQIKYDKKFVYKFIFGAFAIISLILISVYGIQRNILFAYFDVVFLFLGVLIFFNLKEKTIITIAIIMIGGISFLLHTPVFFIGSIGGLFTGYALYKKALKKKSENRERSDGE